MNCDDHGAAVDDHPLIVYGPRAYLVAEASDLTLAAVFSSVSALLADLVETADVVLLDLLLPTEPDVAENVRLIRAAGAQVVVYSSDAAVVSAEGEGVLCRCQPAGGGHQ